MSEHREVSNAAKQQISELLIKNTFLENNIKQLENQLQESKRIYDNLFRTLQSNYYLFFFKFFPKKLQRFYTFFNFKINKQSIIDFYNIFKYFILDKFLIRFNFS